MSGRKSSSLLTIIAIVALCIFCVPLFVKLIDTKKQGSEEQEQTYVILDVYEAEAKFKEESMTIDLLSGCVKSNQQVDKIFINVNGCGTEYLDFKASLITTEDNKQYIAHALTPRNSLLSAAFASNRTLTIDLYVEYGGRSYKVDTQKLAVKSCWIDPIRMSLSPNELPLIPIF